MGTIAVVMATFNGADWLEEQLESIAHQTRRPDRLVISDDGSTDGTVDIARRFARHAPFDVALLEGPDAGPDENFWHAAMHARSDLIAWCDQDNVWDPRKLEICERHLMASATAFVSHSAVVTDAGLVPTGRRFPDYRRTRVLKPLEGDWRECAPGFTQCFRAELLKNVRWQEQPNFGDQRRLGYDGVTTLMAFAGARRMEVRDALASYRQHGGNLTGPAKSFGFREQIRFALSLEPTAYTDTAVLAKEYGRFVKACEPDNEKAVDYFTKVASRCTRRASVHLSSTRWSASRALLTALLRGDYGRRSRGRFGLLALGRDLVGLGSGRRSSRTDAWPDRRKAR